MKYCEIKHSGIKGQKWGVRKYQNPDGTLTPEGKKRYGKLAKKHSDLINDLNKADNDIDRAIIHRAYHEQAVNLLEKQSSKVFLGSGSASLIGTGVSVLNPVVGGSLAAAGLLGLTLNQIGVQTKARKIDNEFNTISEIYGNGGRL